VGGVQSDRQDWGVGEVWLFSRETRAIAGEFQIWLAVDEARRLLVRPPAIERGDFVSWSNVTRGEFERLIAAAEPDDVDSYRRCIDKLPFHLGPCSLCYPGFP
jgi:hypothetical protein